MRRRWNMIVLGTPATPPPAEAKARPRPAGHWRNWRNSGVALSALLHAAVLAALTMSVPVLGRPSAEETAIPVEIVERKPEIKPEEKKEEEPKKAPKPEPPKPEPPKADPPRAESPKAESPKVESPKAEPPKAESPAPPPVPAAKPAPPAPSQPAQPPLRAEAPEPPRAAPEAPPPRPLPAPAVVPPAPRAPGPDGGQKVDADDDGVPPSGGRAEHGYWVLEPLVANLGHRCGLARITGVLELRERLGDGRYRGTMRTRIGWARCPPEGVVHEVELRINGAQVQMIGSGFVDRGVIGKNTMLLEDAYGRSVWKKR